MNVLPEGLPPQLRDPFKTGTVDLEKDPHADARVINGRFPMVGDPFRIGVAPSRWLSPQFDTAGK